MVILDSCRLDEKEVPDDGDDLRRRHSTQRVVAGSTSPVQCVLHCSEEECERAVRRGYEVHVSHQLPHYRQPFRRTWAVTSDDNNVMTGGYSLQLEQVLVRVALELVLIYDSDPDIRQDRGDVLHSLVGTVVLPDTRQPSDKHCQRFA